MTDFERINGPRVEKLIAMLEVIDRSARSNKATEGEVTTLLSPVAQRMKDAVFGDTPVEDEPDT